MKKRLLASFLTIVMLLGMLPTSVFAAETVIKDPFTDLCTEGHVHTDECGTCSHTHDRNCLPEKAVKADWVACVKGETCNAFYDTGWELAHRINWWDDCFWGRDLNDIYGLSWGDENYFSLTRQYRYYGDDWRCTHVHDDTCFTGCGLKEGDGSGHHVWDEGEVITEATCTEPGQIKYTCKNNPDHIYYDDIPVDEDAHDWSAWTESKAATCTEKGEETRVCSNNDEHVDTRETKALGHTEGEAVTENEVAATCTTDGSYDTVVYCTVCGEELSRETTTVDALGHSYDNGVVTTAPTCEGAGVKTFTCSVCGDTYIEAVSATGHTEGEEVTENEVAATCTANGSYDTVVYCTVCGAEISRETTTVPATGHTEGEEVTENEVAATCTVDGSYDTVVYCSVCDAELSRDTTTVPATDHAWGEWTLNSNDNRYESICANDENHVKYAYAVTYEITGTVPEGATGTVTDSASPYEANETVTVKSVPADISDWVFVGWTAPEGLTVTDGAFEMPAEAVNFTGTW